ncbi:MAG: hypothetical protein ABIS03_03345 [Gemmatimonadaceae bacterium]
MYSTCIFCHSSLGTNEAIEHFPVGRRLAFDEAKGRLWAVCAKCGRWNLTPIEERWEAIEECERQFRETLKRSSTDEIGLGRVNEGTDLIRIGKPLRPEFAAWRYTRHFRRRRVMTQVGIGAGVVLFAGGAALGGAFMSIAPLVAQAGLLVRIRNKELTRSKKFLKDTVEAALPVKIRHGERAAIRMIGVDDEQGWGLRLSYDGKLLDLHGRDARHTAHLAAPSMNWAGASSSEVASAVREIEEAKSPEHYFARVLDYGQSRGWKYTELMEYPAAMRLAFEMAAHEETERVAIEGELAQLEADWREAEEVAAIADNMFISPAIAEWVQRMKIRMKKNPD